ncbi:MAG: NADH-quinone oxidoreductase subunit J [Gemmataceae bacterium]
MTLQAAFFWLLAGLTGVSAIMVVVTTNIVRAAVWLLFTLVGTCGVYFLLGADFVGATQLIVYVGGTLVLVVFGVMLTAQGPFVNLRAGPGEWAIATIVGGLFFGVLASTVSFALWTETEGPSIDPATSIGTVQLGQSFLGITEATPKATITGFPAGQTVQPRTPVSYLLPFEIVSVHLLVVLIGAAYLARAKRRRVAA